MGRVDYSIIGKRFGRLLVKSLNKIENGYSWWNCDCDCGNVKVVRRQSLTSGDTISCGCYHKEHINEYGFKHGLSRHPLYKIWARMIQYCSNPKSPKYHRYGGRGIRVCDEWKLDFVNFYEWSIINGYKKELSIDRIDNDGNYEPSNCRWATRKEQQNNMHNNHYVEFNGERKTLSQWSQILGVNHETLRYRVNNNNMSDFEKYAKELIICE